ncbi:hypothetical protein OG455_18505 [Kitasatospora sp. NBC_01287]|uniref:hypothetical protein n=1 Tax=Kitasatospora sp. NBC_01287 TaxID=2903573 RepID=UPI00225B6DF3|nr:hypothetical protein [Kitasatospora sp. NBC_01287]MCX4747484.1 hypothetical protein [Kitasatospora sp. NBC_01287]
MEPEQPRTVEQVRGLVSWIGAGRKLTQTGKVTLADARTLVTLLETGDTIDPAIGDRTFKTKSSQELYHLNLLVEWAKAARLLRVTGGRLVPVKKNARLLEDPERLLDALFEALPRIGETVLPSGWLGSMFAVSPPRLGLKSRRSPVRPRPWPPRLTRHDALEAARFGGVFVFDANETADGHRPPALQGSSRQPRMAEQVPSGAGGPVPSESRCCPPAGADTIARSAAR